MKQEVLGIFPYLDDLLEALAMLRQKGGHVLTVYSPIHSEEILEALGSRPSPVRLATLLGGIGGLLGGLGLAVYTFLEWKFVTSAKPTPPVVPLVVVGFEMTILLGFLATLVTMWIVCKMPSRRLPDHYEAGFSQDRFGLLVEPGELAEQELLHLLKMAGAEEVRLLRGSATEQS